MSNEDKCSSAATTTRILKDKQVAYSSTVQKIPHFVQRAL